MLQLSSETPKSSYNQIKNDAPTSFQPRTRKAPSLQDTIIDTLYWFRPWSKKLIPKSRELGGPSNIPDADFLVSIIQKTRVCFILIMDSVNSPSLLPAKDGQQIASMCCLWLPSRSIHRKRQIICFGFPTTVDEHLRVVIRCDGGDRNTARSKHGQVEK